MRKTGLNKGFYAESEDCSYARGKPHHLSRISLHYVSNPLYLAVQRFLSKASLRSKTAAFDRVDIKRRF